MGEGGPSRRVLVRTEKMRKGFQGAGDEGTLSPDSILKLSPASPFWQKGGPAMAMLKQAHWVEGAGWRNKA
jgi:hypothetical protein